MVRGLAGPDPSGPLLTPDVLAAARSGASDTVVLDASAAPPGTAHDPDAAFAAARIPGARRFDLDRFSDPESTLPHTVPTAARFARLAGELGVGPNSMVVVYEAGRLFAAARAWFLFRLFGHDRVWVLDGGLGAWRAAGLPIESGPIGDGSGEGGVPPGEARRFRRFVPRFRAQLLAGLGDVRDGVPEQRLLLDARTAGRFAGTAPEPRPGIPSGAIPGSRNLPYDRLLAPDGRLLPREALRAMFAAAGIEPSGDRAPGSSVIVSCGTGVTAAVLALGMAAAGLPAPALFDGSWTEWATAAAVESGAAESGAEHATENGAARA